MPDDIRTWIAANRDKLRRSYIYDMARKATRDLGRPVVTDKDLAAAYKAVVEEEREMATAWRPRE